MAVEIAPKPRIVVVTKGGEPATDLILEHEEAFLHVMQDESAKALLVILRWIGRYGDVDGLRLPLSATERQAFADLVLAGEAGWAWGHDEIIASLRRRPEVRKADDFDPSSMFDFEAKLYGMPRSFSAQYMQRRELELAGVYEQARLRQTKVVVERAIREGHGIPGIQQKVGKLFPSFTEGRLRNIARTEANTLFSHGKFARLKVSPYVIGYEFFAVMDARTTDICASRNGRHYAKGSTVDVPPLHFQAIAEGEPCLTSRGELSIEEVRVGEYVLTHGGRWQSVTAKLRRRWQGATHTIRTDAGELRLTPEHPVLTSRGWIGAEGVVPGDRIIGCEPAQELDRLPADFTAQAAVSTTILRDSDGFEAELPEAVVAALILRAAAGVPAAIELDHQVFGGEEEVDHVPGERHLKAVITAALEAEAIQRALEALLVHGRIPRVRFGDGLGPALDDARHTARILLAHPPTRGRVLDAEAGVAALGMAQRRSLGAIPGRHAGGQEPPADRVATDAALLRDGQLGHAGFVCSDGAPNDSHRDSHTRYYTVRANVCKQWAGRAYDLSVAGDESYCVGGHFVHNCRSELLAIFTDEKIDPTPLPIDAPDPITWRGKKFGSAPDITGFEEKLARQRPLPALWVPKGKRRIKPRPKPPRKKKPVPTRVAPLRAKLLGKKKPVPVVPPLPIVTKTGAAGLKPLKGSAVPERPGPEARFRSASEATEEERAAAWDSLMPATTEARRKLSEKAHPAFRLLDDEELEAMWAHVRRDTSGGGYSIHGFWDEALVADRQWEVWEQAIYKRAAGEPGFAAMPDYGYSEFWNSTKYQVDDALYYGIGDKVDLLVTFDPEKEWLKAAKASIAKVRRRGRAAVKKLEGEVGEASASVFGYADKAGVTFVEVNERTFLNRTLAVRPRAEAEAIADSIMAHRWAIPRKKVMRERYREAIADLAQMASNDVIEVMAEPLTVKLLKPGSGDGRASASWWTKTINSYDTDPAMVHRHEILHIIEGRLGDRIKTAGKGGTSIGSAWRDVTTRKRAKERLRDLSGSTSYRVEEMAYRGPWRSNYTGKVYWDEGVSEAVSMGSDLLRRATDYVFGPIGRRPSPGRKPWTRTDRSQLEYTIGVLRNGLER